MRNKPISIFISFILIGLQLRAQVRVHELTCELLKDPYGIDVTAPRLSWQLSSTKNGLLQTGYRLLVSNSKENADKFIGDVWNTGTIEDHTSINVPYHGKSLESSKTYYWRVQSITNQGTSNWSSVAKWTTALMHPSEWNARWMGFEKANISDSITKFARLSARYFRKEVSADKKIMKAVAYISGLGLYEFYVNGTKIGDHVLTPGPTDYSKSILYNTYDITSSVHTGKNAFGLILGNGRFFTMRQNYKPLKWHNFGKPRALVQIELLYQDGTKSFVYSDDSWKVNSNGPIIANNEYDGEEYDANKEFKNWTNVGFNDGSWDHSELVASPGSQLVAQLNKGMKVMQQLTPLSITASPTGSYIVDMGQNMAGWLKINVHGNIGDTVTMKFAESLQPNGSLYIANLRDAHVTDKYILNGSVSESWSPRFVYHGFRYVEIKGLKYKPEASQLIGEVIYDEMQNASSFTSSNATLNKIQQAAYWGIRDNYKGMPIDCPQRDERQPWLGDRTTGAMGESFLFGNARLYAKWLDDIQQAQKPDGSIPDVAPSFWFYYKDNMTWPGAYVSVAEMLYKQYGDIVSIQKHYPYMRKWIWYMKEKYSTKNHLMKKDSYADWCVPPESLELIHAKEPSRLTDPTLIATAYYYHYLNLLQDFARLSGNTNDIDIYQHEAIQVKQSFNDSFYHAGLGYYGNNTATANLLPLAFNLVHKGNEEKVKASLIHKVETIDKGMISTGVIGTSWLMRTLVSLGRSDLSLKLGTNTGYPSWGYMIEQGATTIWELWNGNTANPAMNSQNHVMLLGDLLIWMYEDLAGIKSDNKEVAFKRIVMKPQVMNQLNEVNATYHSLYGDIASHWSKSNGVLKWNFSIPGNTLAEIHLPASCKLQQDVSKMGMKMLSSSFDEVILEVGSGDHELVCTY